MNRRRASLLLALAVVSAARAEEPALNSAVVEAWVTTDGKTSVDARYFLEPAGAPEIELTSLTFAGARAANIRAFVGDREVSFHSRETPDGRLDGTVSLPTGVERPRLRLTYEALPISGASLEPGIVAIPIMVARWPPRDALPGSFRATVSLPAGTVAYTGFPSDFERVASVDRTSDATVYSFSMPVMPALLRLGVAQGPTPLLTLERTVDVATVGLLLVMAVFGWRRLRKNLA